MSISSRQSTALRRFAMFQLTSRIMVSFRSDGPVVHYQEHINEMPHSICAKELAVAPFAEETAASASGTSGPPVIAADSSSLSALLRGNDGPDVELLDQALDPGIVVLRRSY